ncbi:MAG: type II/IV secretion system ATPase subunit [Candidatus Methanoplasma sp.]|jgi:type IV secretory pathway ATPase VirB11/archaellum biosynthesis ATPase|nr:type II/IV secretion system ATPase subunit [Candidatus Methanoplasma sp.]
MPRILSGISGRLSRRNIEEVSYNDRLIVTDYSDSENEFYRKGSTDTRRPVCEDQDVLSENSADSCNYEAQQTYGDRRQERVRRENLPNQRSVLEGLVLLSENNVRTKPAYADCWLIGKRSDLENTCGYDSPGGSVTVGIASDGETEYNLTPAEYSYPDSVNAVIEKVISGIRERYTVKGGRMDRQSVIGFARGMLIDHSDTIEAVYGRDADTVERIIGEMCEIIYRYTVGMGIFEVLLSDPKLEDIYIDAPCDRNRIHVTMNGTEGGNSHIKCRTNLVVDKKEVLNLINILKRDSGLQFCESNPILETDIKAHDARATVVGYPMSPNGDAVAIRKHSVKPWTLTRLIANGTMDPRIAGLLSFLVDNRATFLICGARGAGKSSLLSSLMFEFPLSQRILTIEDTMELPSAIMRKMGYKVQSMLIDDRMGGDNLSRADEALRVSLRMGESAIVLGEVRGEEARTMYQSMRTGRAGSSIMGTIHGDSARSVYERVVHDMNIAPEAFMATDILVTLGTVRDRRTGNQIRKVNEVVSTTDLKGEFIDISDSTALFSSPVMKRILSTSQMNRADIVKEIRARAVIRSFLAEMGKNHGDEYLGPVWIGIANEHVSKSQGKTAEDVLISFKSKFSDLTGIGV